MNDSEHPHGTPRWQTRPVRNWRHPSWIAPLLALLALAPGGHAAAEERKAPFRSWTGLRLQNVVAQRLDFSCGAASIATIATYFLGKPVTEEQALKIIRARYDAEEWKKKKQDGLSFEDLDYIAEALKLKTEGVKIGLAGLLKLSGPIIVHLNKVEFQHFTVLRGIRGMTVYLADPITGTVPMPLGTFLDQFTGNALAVWEPGKQLATEHVLKTTERDTYHDNAYNVVRPSMQDQGTRFTRPFF